MYIDVSISNPVPLLFIPSSRFGKRYAFENSQIWTRCLLSDVQSSLYKEDSSVTDDCFLKPQQQSLALHVLLLKSMCIECKGIHLFASITHRCKSYLQLSCQQPICLNDKMQGAKPSYSVTELSFWMNLSRKRKSNYLFCFFTFLGQI